MSEWILEIWGYDGMDWIELAQNKDQIYSVGYTAMNLGALKRRGELIHKFNYC
jgi:hypothetical protein